MNALDQYQAAARATLTPSADCLEYLNLGLVAEAGEVAGKYAKYLRDGGDREALREATALELGDVLWFVAMLAHHHGFALSDIAARNTFKLESRKARGVISGSGDTR